MRKIASGRQKLGYERVDQNGGPTVPDSGFWSGDVGGLLVQQISPWSQQDSAWRLHILKH